MNFLVAGAGFLNAGGIAAQAVKLMQTKDPTSISLPMFGMFLFIQAVYTARGIQNNDKLMAGGMLASAVATLWVITLVFVYQ
jgi:uncharacterized protein with PQ loop repeat